MLRVVVAPAVLLGLAACTSGTPAAEQDACTAIHAWETGGRDPERYDHAVASAQDALSEPGRGSLTAAAEALAGAAVPDRATAVEGFLARCADLGWQPPEG
ncbi:hypothetical protein DNL40_10735 [Xylanimonas oleitrophica]|uniref:Lipoprotein n=2 Tax=Xylanimonas oleitrophica TaxID=2607479 RepID=A0A2W5YE15_9MICO|nr:hypothetical protein DNL40_10735 [Xylanimonas oleitrophica]